MEKELSALEQEAFSFLSQEKFDEAYKLFVKVAEMYRQRKNHKQAALCAASAASCWALRSGEKSFYNAAAAYEAAARDAEIVGDLEYASLLYRYAATSFERDMESLSFSECFYRSKECYRRFLMFSLFAPKKINRIASTQEQDGVKSFVKRLFMWCILTLSSLVWGHGERPVRTLFAGFLLVFVSALLYSQHYLLQDGKVFKPDFFEAFYFSLVALSTTGFGDIAAVGFSRVIVVAELSLGMFIMPLFLVGFSRKYLRI
jgi:hypothetical protein